MIGIIMGVKVAGSEVRRLTITQVESINGDKYHD